MITSKHPFIARRTVAVVCAITTLAGCNAIGSLLESDRVDYKSAGKAPSLEVPPDLTKLQRENRYAIPDGNRGTATASGFAQQRSVQQAPTSATSVAPKAAADMRIERAGSQRWLVVRQTPEQLWPQIKDFWQDNGFIISIEAPQTGVMETDWAENRAKIPQDFIRNTLGRVLDSFYSTGERDKFRTRLERGADGSTEIYLSHRGAQEVIVGQQKDGTVWTGRPSDPELEAEFLARLMSRLGAEEVQAKTNVVNAPVQATRAKLVKTGNAGYVEVNEGFDRAWRRVGLALDRVGFTVEDRDRSQGLYFVRYVDQGEDAKNKAEKSFFSRMFSFGSSDDKARAQRYRVSVKGAADSTQVGVLDNEGRPINSATADRILSLLNEQLR